MNYQLDQNRASNYQSYRFSPILSVIGVKSTGQPITWPSHAFFFFFSSYFALTFIAYHFLFYIYFFMDFESSAPSPTPFTSMTPTLEFVNHSSPPSNLRKCMDINGRGAQSTNPTLRHLHFLNPFTYTNGREAQSHLGHSHRQASQSSATSTSWQTCPISHFHRPHLAHKLGPIIHLRVGRVPTVVVSSANLASSLSPMFKTNWFIELLHQ